MALSKLPKFMIPDICEECGNHIIDYIIHCQLTGCQKVIMPPNITLTDWYPLFRLQGYPFNVVYYNFNKKSRYFMYLLSSELNEKNEIVIEFVPDHKRFY